MMNDEARELLVAAAMRGHRQAIGSYHHETDQSDCALGVLHLSLHASRVEAITCSVSGITHLLTHFDISYQERQEIIYRNDNRRQDFLTIARKVGTETL